MIDNIAIYDGVLKNDDLETMLIIEDVFGELEYVDHQLELSECESLDDDGLWTDLDKGLAALDVYMKHTSQILSQMGLSIVDDKDIVTPRTMAVILQSIIALEDIENRDIIEMEMVAYDGDDYMSLISLLAQVSEESEVYFMNTIEDISPALWVRIMKLNGGARGYELGDEVNKGIKGRLVAAYDGIMEGPVFEYIKNTPMLPITLSKATPHVIYKILEMKQADMAFEVLVLLLAAGYEGEELKEQGDVLFEEYFLPEKVGAMKLELASLLEGIEHE